MANYEAKLINDTKVLTGKIRFSYAHLFEPWGANGAEPKYSVSILIPKSDTKTVEVIRKAIENATAEAVQKYGKNFKSARLHTPIHDGDVEKPGDEAYAGQYYINCNNRLAPQVVDINCDRIEDPEEVYSGAYGRITLNFYGYSVSGNTGIAASLQNVQKLEDGERLGGGRSSALADFGGAGEDFLN